MVLRDGSSIPITPTGAVRQLYGIPTPVFVWRQSCMAAPSGTRRVAVHRLLLLIICTSVDREFQFHASSMSRVAKGQVSETVPDTRVIPVRSQVITVLAGPAMLIPAWTES